MGSSAPTKLVVSGGGGGGGTDQLVKVTFTDTVAGYLAGKLVVHPDTPLTLNILNPAANESLEFDLDGDQITIDWIPSNYVRNATIPEAADVEDLAAHLKGIDDALGTLGGGKPFLQFSGRIKVPASGILYLSSGEVATSASPIVIAEAITMYGATIKVDVVDASRAYILEFLQNGSVVETLSLPVSTIENTTISYTTSLSAGDDISVRVRKTSGTGPSSFSNISVILITEA